MTPSRKFILRLLLVALVLAVWEVLVRILAIPAFVLPTPSSVLVALWRGLSSRLYIPHFGITLVETLLGFAAGSLLAWYSARRWR